MPVSSSTEHWIKPDALTINLNHFGDPDYLQVSVLAGAVVMAFKQDVIGYNAAHNYRTWQLEAANTYLETSSVYNIYARLTRSEVNARALIVYDTVLRDIEGREISYTENGNEVLGDASADYFFVFLGQISGSVGSNGQSVQREWLIDFRFGSLDTSQYRNEESGGEWQKMFRLNKMTDMIDVLKTFSSATFKKLFIGEKVVSGIKRSIDNDNESPVSDETIPTTKYINKVIDDMDGKFLRKDKDDRSVGKISSDKGFEAGTYVNGLVGGSGAWIGADGYGEMNGLTLREFLEVPELRFNRVDVVSGELWNAVAFGLVEEVEITGGETGILKIKLEENERCGLHVGDFCRGIFADFGSGSNWEGPDECNFLHLYGFWTSYFTPTKIIEDKEGLFVCEYALKPETKQHPTKSMKFAVYGNPTDTTRQASAYATRTYKRYLNNVDTWVIEPDRHIYAQYGDLNGLVINGVEMKGYGSFQSNAYFRGVQIQLSPEQIESLKGDSAYAAQLTNNVGTIRLDKNGNMAEGLYEESIVTAIKDGEEAEVTAKDENGQESTVTVTNHKLTTTVQAYKGNVPLFYSTTGTSGSFTVSLTCVGCTAFVVNGSVIVSSITSTKDCRVNVTVNCEGMAVYNLVYNILFVKDGKDGINGSDGSDGADGSDGEDASVYTVLPNLTAISRTVTGSLSPSNVTFTCYKDTGTSDRTEESATWKMYGRNTADGSWTEIQTQDSYSSTFSVGFSDSYKYYRIEAYPYGTRPIVLEPFIVSDGTPGTNGKRGAIARYCGEYKEGVEYVYNDEFRDIVIYKGNVFQVLSYGSTVTDVPTVSDSSDNDGKWQMASKFNFVAMDTALIDNANIAGFVFTRDGYKDGAPYGRLSSQLSTEGVPNLEIDAYNGSIRCNNVDLSGVINATSGVFSGYIRTNLVNIIDSDAIQVEPQFTTNGYAYKLNRNVYVDATFEEVVLPCTEEYNGVRVIIMDSYYLKSRIATPPTIIRTEDGSTIKCGLYGGDKPSGSQYQMSSIRIDCGAVELIYKYIQTDYGQQRAWIVLNHSCGIFEEY